MAAVADLSGADLHVSWSLGAELNIKGVEY